ncbi:thiamine-phosphate kinase [Pseudomonas fluorescens]|uniref:Thiamine-monophosphate kinase n=1 Tax=Pseudomonas fluorescens TaxID=294 RepID=A0A5E6RMW7_PSEFL|nr:thiamine-phosphate kinase [Pseudomonas fluorescens]VVM69470.1 Thiamine-monophosphate kinase [Pseudomonas fluorescens]
MGEFELIRNFFAAAPCAQGGEGVALGIGDDCALLAVPPGEQLAISTDTLVAGVHFADPCDPFLLGQRSLAVAVSDLAAMGATPVAFTLALTVPTVTADWLQAYAHGLNRMAQSCGVALVGGDTTRGPLSLTVTVFGRVPAEQALTRSGAQPGDLLCVGGELGNAAGALPLVLGQREAEAHIAQPLLDHYWSPQPHVAIGRALRGAATAAQDIADRVHSDWRHNAPACKVPLELDSATALNLHTCRRLFGQRGAERAALSGGDDYVLAFTLPSVELPALLANGWPIHVIGRVAEGQGVILLDREGHDITPQIRGYQHFQETP